MKSIVIITFLTLAVLLSCCEEEALKSENILDENRIFGKWKLESRAINGISNLAVECCDYIEFEQENQNDNLNGRFEAYGYQYETQGTFTLNLEEQSILFQYDDTQKLYTYALKEDALLFHYIENGKDVSEVWRKEP
jgi:hypothetical protein